MACSSCASNAASDDAFSTGEPLMKNVGVRRIGILPPNSEVRIDLGGELVVVQGLLECGHVQTRFFGLFFQAGAVEVILVVEQ